MFGKKGPSFFELMEQAWSGTAEGYDLLAPKFEATPFCTPPAVVPRAPYSFQRSLGYST